MIELALSKVKLPSNPSEMTAVELYPGINILLIKLNIHSFIRLSKGFGAWTVAMANAGFQRIIALENNAKYAKWMGVRNHSTSFQGSCSFSGFLEHCTRIKRRGGTSQEGWL